MAKGGQKKGKAKGHSKSSSSSGSSYSSPSYPPSSISAPRTVTVKGGTRTGGTRQVNILIARTNPINEKDKITSKGRRRLTMNTAYCMKCRKKVEIKQPRQVVMRNGRPAVSGTCPYCGTKVFKIGK